MALRRKLALAGERINIFTRRRRCIAFVYARNRRFESSSYMRGLQLAKLIQENGEVDQKNIAYQESTNLERSFVFLTKSACKRVDPSEIARLKKKGNVIAADFVDLPPQPDVCNAVDVLVAASHRQLSYYREFFPGKPSYLLTHHIDTRINLKAAQNDVLKIGYFGNIFNTKYLDELKDTVDFFYTDTRKSDIDWACALPRYNLHYAVRGDNPSTAFKPFLKGFLAAHCGANILVHRDEGDALQYLTEDYPYLLTADDYSSVADMLRHIRESFGTPEWYQAKEIMRSVAAASSQRTVMRELMRIIQDFGQHNA